MWPGAAFIDSEGVSPGLSAYTSVSFAFEHFYHMDHANACIHEAEVRYSPITFGLARVLGDLGSRSAEVLGVLADIGEYELDPGR